MQTLWKQLTSSDNLWEAYRKAATGKRGKTSTAAFEMRLEVNLLTLQDELLSEEYQPGAYDSFYIHDPKRRLISAAPFRDRVVHHALVNIIGPIYENKFIHDTYANRLGKGTHRALDRCTYYMRRFAYVLPVDVRQYFPSIDHDILMEIFKKSIRDEHVLGLCQKILNSGSGILKNEYDMVYFPGDDLWAVNRARGLPIGNLTSQFWANVYLNGFDHFVKRSLKCEGYVRYVDDFLLFSNDKAALHSWHDKIIEYMAGLRLTIHENSTQVRPCQSGLPFLGFQVFPDHRRLKRRKGIQARRHLKTLLKFYEQGQIEQARLTASVKGWVNHARYGDTWGLRQAILGEMRLPPSGK